MLLLCVVHLILPRHSQPLKDLLYGRKTRMSANTRLSSQLHRESERSSGRVSICTILLGNLEFKVSRSLAGGELQSSEPIDFRPKPTIGGPLSSNPSKVYAMRVLGSVRPSSSVSRPTRSRKAQLRYLYAVR